MQQGYKSTTLVYTKASAVILFWQPLSRKQLPKQNAMAALALDVVVQQVLDAESESETAHENDVVVPDIGKK